LLAGQEAFWPWLTRCHQAYVAAVIGEREIQARRPPAYSRAERDEIAAGKGACGKASLAVLALLGGAKEPPAALLKSYDALCISYQLYDDLLDWRQDYAAGFYSYLVVQALDQWQRHHGATGAARLTADELGQVIYYGGPARDALAEAHAYAEQAIELARNSGCPAWIAALRGVQSLYARLSTVGVERRA
jgi:geranylgeranyl pyrophosphate synthase